MSSETGKAELHDLPHSSCPVTAVWVEVLQHDNAIDHQDGRTRVVRKVSVLIFYLSVCWTHLKLEVISFKV